MSKDLSALSDSELHTYFLKALEPLDNEVHFKKSTVSKLSKDLSEISDSELHASSLKALEPLDSEVPDPFMTDLDNFYFKEITVSEKPSIDTNKKVDAEKKKFTFKPVEFPKTKTNISEESKKDKRMLQEERMKLEEEKRTKRLERFGTVQEKHKQPAHSSGLNTTKRTANPAPTTDGESSNRGKVTSKSPVNMLSRPQERPKNIRKSTVFPFKQDRTSMKKIIENSKRKVTAFKPFMNGPAINNPVDHGRVSKNSGKKQESTKMTNSSGQSSINHQNKQMSTFSRIKKDRRVTTGTPQPGPSNHDILFHPPSPTHNQYKSKLERRSTQ